MTKKQDIQETLMRIESDRKELESMMQQGRMLESSIVEIRATIEVLEQLKKNKPGTEIMVPIGSDSFIRASIKDNERVLIGVGARVSVEKKIDDAVETLKGRAEELSSALVGIRERAMQVNNEMEGLSQEAQTMMQRQNLQE